jgi:hypothetical protein
LLAHGDSRRDGHAPGFFVPGCLRQKCAAPTAGEGAHAMDKLQRAGRDFLIRLIAKHGLAGAARVLRALANELEWLRRAGPKTMAGAGPGPWTCDRPCNKLQAACSCALGILAAAADFRGIIMVGTSSSTNGAAVGDSQ